MPSGETIPEAPASVELTERTARVAAEMPPEEPQKSSRSTREIIRDGVKKHGYITATASSGTLVGGVYLLAEFLEKLGKITSAVGLQMTALFIGALVLLAVYLARREKAEGEAAARQEKREAEARAEREQARQFYRDIIEREHQHDRDAAQDMATVIKDEVHKLGKKVDNLVEIIVSAQQRGAVYRFPPPVDPPGERRG